MKKIQYTKMIYHFRRNKNERFKKSNDGQKPTYYLKSDIFVPKWTIG